MHPENPRRLADLESAEPENRLLGGRPLKKGVAFEKILYVLNVSLLDWRDERSLLSGLRPVFGKAAGTGGRGFAGRPGIRMKDPQFRGRTFPGRTFFCQKETPDESV